MTPYRIIINKYHIIILEGKIAHEEVKKEKRGGRRMSFFIQ